MDFAGRRTVLEEEQPTRSANSAMLEKSFNVEIHEAGLGTTRRFTFMALRRISCWKRIVEDASE
jgi:hypothetical protein